MKLYKTVGKVRLGAWAYNIHSLQVFAKDYKPMYELGFKLWFRRWYFQANVRFFVYSIGFEVWIPAPVTP